MPQFRDQFDAAQTPRAAAYALRLGHAYDNPEGFSESGVFELINRMLLDSNGNIIIDSSGNIIFTN